MKNVSLLLAGFVLVAPAAAQDTPAPDRTPVAKPATEKKVCRYQASSGTIMPSRRVCRSKADWMASDAANQANTDAVLQRREHGSMGRVQ